MSQLGQAIRDSLTDIDGNSYAIIKILGMLIVIVFLGLVIASFVTGKAFDSVAYGTGAGLAIAAMAAGIRLTEPQPPKDPKQ